VVQVTSHDKKYPGLISVIETSLLRAVWYPSSVATLSREIKKNLKVFIELNSDLDPDVLLPTMLNDFGARGVSSGESAALGGLAHAVNFIGSDTFEAIDAAVLYYDHNLDRDGPVIVSVPATEHSVTTINGPEGESKFIGATIETFTGMGFPIISLVADSYDLDNFVTNIVGRDNHAAITDRNGFIVVRPDSGEPTQIVPRVLNLLWEKFGGTINSKGYRVLNAKVRVIQGDGVNYDSINEILIAVGDADFSCENIVFGMGGKLLQGVMRDDQSWAMKTNAVHYRPGEVAGHVNWVDVQKKPKTDPSKASKAGRQAVVYFDGTYHSMREDDLKLANAVGHHGAHNYLERVWEAGKVLRTTTFKEVRERAAI
jgi:nicotinamide phosphoribosyltransferase